MKKVTILVPDTIICVDGASDSIHHENVNVDTNIIELALTTNDYHNNYYFPEGSITVVSVEEYKD